MSVDAQHWEDVYSQTDPKALPWNAGGPDSDLVRLVTDGTIPVGQALDIGTGPGHDAVFLIHHGFNVIGIDISPSAVKLARENASNAGLFGFFQEGDIRQIPVEDRFIDFAYDRGCFHMLSSEDRPKAATEVWRVLKKDGLYLLRVFSDKETGTDGPHRFTRKELEDLFKGKFKILKIWEGVFEGPMKPKSYSMLMEKK
jgi:ubiquinone/menaquinone biosynthesis C-methylase UbiE